MGFISNHFISWTLRFWPLGILLSLSLLAGGLWLSKGLGLDTDLEGLLPNSAQSVQHMKLIKPKAGGSSDFRVVFGGGDFESRLRAVQEFQTFLQTETDAFQSVQFETPKAFLEDKKYQLIPVDQLQGLLQTVRQERQGYAEVTDPFGLEAMLDEEEAAAELTEEEKEEQLEEARRYLSQLEDMHPFYQTADGEYLAIRAVPKVESLNMSENRRLITKMEGLIDQFDISQFHPGDESLPMVTYLHGNIVDQVHQFDSIVRDVKFGGWAILLILTIVIVYFRSLWPLLIMVPPLLTGLSVGLGLTTLVEEQLNTISVFLVIVVFGLSIDFAIHLWARMTQERQAKNLPDALRETWRTTGRATVTSGAALLAGFAILMASSFQGFAQFGKVAVILITTCLLSFLFLMPSWIVLTERLRGGSKHWPLSLAQLLTVGQYHRYIPWGGITFRGVRILSALIIIVGIVSTLLYLRFDYEFDDGVTRQAGASRQIMRDIFTERLKPSAVAVFESKDEAADFLGYYQDHQDDFPEIALMTGLPTFLPVDQWERIDLLQELADELDGGFYQEVEEEDLRDSLREIHLRAYEMMPYTRSDLPPELREPFLATDNSGDYLVYLFDIGGRPDGRKAMHFAAAVERFQNASGIHPILSGQELVFADIVSRVISEGPWLVLAMFFLVFLICWLDFRNIRHAMFTVSPVVGGFFLTALVMILTDTRINFYNMVALASLGAIVVDNSIHLYHRFLEYQSMGLPEADRQASIAVGPTVTACTLTSMSGYSGMLFANHLGISSLGFVAVLGLFCCLISAVVFFPPWLHKAYEHQRIA